ncbi:hypothetical protein BDD12DRAFT_947879 [Trichophaea hybrida]|nr:hypothetical protein BDD12DRAFT_947879 [Trichophaea hybrida]
MAPTSSNSLVAYVTALLSGGILKTRTSPPPIERRIKPRTFRISAIPRDITEDGFRTYLTGLLEDGKPDDFIISLVPYALGQEQTATVTFTRREPSPFSECAPGNRMPLDSKEMKAHIVVDCDFLGITPLYSAEEPIVDIIAVTGLAGHAFGSWMSRTQPRMWLRDFLPVNLCHANIRILTFGYDSALRDSTSSSSIQPFSRQLLDSERYRPIIFIAHSLGGLIIKQALTDASPPGGSDDDHAILNSCAGLFFFGVPNRGLNIENIMTLVKDQRNSHFINDLRETSTLLKHVHNQFLQVSELKDCKTTSFYETKDTKTVVVREDGRWERCGKMVRMVTEESATCALPTEPTHMQIPIDADHSNMVKFTDNQSDAYIRVWKRLEQSVKEAPSIVENRLASVGKLTVPEALFMIPFSRNPDFVGRDDIFEQLGRLLSLTGKRDCQLKAALWGLGGIGKTTIAVEFCYRRRKEQPRAHILWVHGNTSQTFKASYLELAQEAHLTVMGDDEEASLDKVKKWLDSSASVKEYIPVKRGTILFTTRDERLIGHASLSAKAGVQLREMSNKDALETFAQLLGDSGAAVRTHAEASRQLLGLLENLPLAIAQAAAYIRETRMKLPKYLEMFKEYQQDFLTDPLPRAIENDGLASRAVMTTWKITVEKIERENHISIKLLQLISFFNHEEIPEELMEHAEFFENQGPKFFTDALKPLINFALLYCIESSIYRLHRLVAFWIRVQMDSKDQQEKQERLETAVSSIYNILPREPQSDLRKCTRLLPHAVATLEHCRGDLEISSCLDLQELVGIVFWEKGDYSSALKWYQRALDGREKILGRDHPDTLTTVNNMALVFDKQGEYIKALEWYQRVLDGREKILGRDHPHTLTTVSNMALVFGNQGEYIKALEWYQRALDGWEKILGRDHLDTLTTVSNMALVFGNQGEYIKALEWYQRALDGWEKILGRDHPHTLTTVSNMAGVFGDQGEYIKALEWYQRALDGWEKILGRDHPHTLTTVSNMAGVFDNQGEYIKALEWYQRALDGREKILGRDYPHTLTTVNDMAGVFGNQGEYIKALEWYQRALDGWEKILGRDHPHTLTTVNNMAGVFGNQGEYIKALEWYQRALDGWEKILGRDHPHTLTTVNNMALVFGNQGEYIKALEWYQRALDGREKILGRDHPDTLTTISNLAVVKNYLSTLTSANINAQGDH